MGGFMIPFDSIYEWMSQNGFVILGVCSIVLQVVLLISIVFEERHYEP